MATFFEEQPDTDNLIECTHFDTWFEDEDDEPFERQALALERFENAPIEIICKIMLDVLEHWEKSLGVSIISPLTETHGGSLEQTVLACGYDNTWNLVIIQLLGAGYSVFKGSNFIEIYSEEAE